MCKNCLWSPFSEEEKESNSRTVTLNDSEVEGYFCPPPPPVFKKKKVVSGHPLVFKK